MQILFFFTHSNRRKQTKSNAYHNAGHFSQLSRFPIRVYRQSLLPGERKPLRALDINYCDSPARSPPLEFDPTYIMMYLSAFYASVHRKREHFPLYTGLGLYYFSRLRHEALNDLIRIIIICILLLCVCFSRSRRHPF